MGTKIKEGWKTQSLIREKQFELNLPTELPDQECYKVEISGEGIQNKGSLKQSHSYEARMLPEYGSSGFSFPVKTADNLPPVYMKKEDAEPYNKDRGRLPKIFRTPKTVQFEKKTRVNQTTIDCPNSEKKPSLRDRILLHGDENQDGRLSTAENIALRFTMNAKDAYQGLKKEEGNPKKIFSP
jgi:hypothetical protein